MTADAEVVASDTIEAYEELAVYYEHRARQPARALELTREALATLRCAARVGLITPERHARLRARLERRLERLQRKLAPRASPRPSADSASLRYLLL